jgi:hypothetical protein
MIASSKRVAAAMALLMLPRVAMAAPSAPTEAELETARSLYREAVALHRQDKHEEALARITAAYRMVQTPVIALELARLDAQLGRLAEAYEAARSIEDLPVSARETDKGRDARREAAALAASLRPRLATIRVLLPSAPEAEARIDGSRLESAEQGRIAQAGPHVVTLHVGDRTCASASVSVAEGELRAVDLRDRASACGAETTGAAPVEAKGRAPVASDAPPPRADAPVADTGPNVARWVAYGLVGAGAVATVTGSIVALRARSDYDSVAAECWAEGCTAYGFGVREAARTHATQATYAIVLGLGAIAGGITLWILDPGRDRAHGRRVGVAVAPNGVWMSVPIP